MLQQRKFIAEASIPVRVRRPVAQPIMPARGKTAVKVKAGYPCPKMNVTLKAVKSLARYKSNIAARAIQMREILPKIKSILVFQTYYLMARSFRA
jgi:hypothetical protein